MRATSPDGTVVGCEVVGEGPPLLVVHGSISDRTRWEAVRERLGARFRLHLMDRRGRGLSVAEAPEYALAREAEDVTALAAAIGDRVPVLAHSYGATVTLAALAAGAPLGALVLYEPPFLTDLGPGIAPDALAAMEAALAVDDRDAVLELFFARALRLDARTIAALRAAPAWRVRAGVAHTLPREAREVNAYRLDPARLAAVAGPATVLVGTETTPALQRSTRDAHAALPGAELVELGGQGHAAMDTDPAGFVAAVVGGLGRVS